MDVHFFEQTTLRKKARKDLSVAVFLTRIGVLALGIVLFGGLSGCGGSGEASRSIVLITIDTLRADHVSAYGYARTTSPKLDAFLERGTRFRHAFAPASSTAPSHTSMLTGLYPSFHSVGVQNGNHVLSEQTETLAEICSRAGMTTAAIVSNPVLGSFLRLDQGFDHYDDDLQAAERNRGIADQIGKDAVDKAIAMLDEIRDRPFFLWLHLQDPHGPYEPPREVGDWGVPDGGRALEVGVDDVGYDRIPAYQKLGELRNLDAYVDRYDREIRYLDDELDRLLTHIGDAGLLKTTLVAITADHGESMGEEGFYFAHSHSVALDQVHVPLGFVGPNVDEGRVIDRPVSGIDLFATLLDFSGLDVPAGSPSRTLVPFLSGEPDPDPQRAIFTECVTQRGIVLDGRYLRRTVIDLTAQPAPSVAGGTDWRRIELGQELTTLDGEAVGTGAARLESVLAAFHTEAVKSSQALDAVRQGAELSEEDIDRLRRLGYTHDSKPADAAPGSK